MKVADVSRFKFSLQDQVLLDKLMGFLDDGFEPTVSHYRYRKDRQGSSYYETDARTLFIASSSSSFAIWPRMTALETGSRCKSS